MERCAFVVEETGERLSCLLNPEHVVLRRTAGLRPLPTGTGSVTGTGLTDTPLLHTGGGRTEIELELLFDVDVDRALNPRMPPPLSPAIEGQETPAQPVPPAPDVRELTRPLWNLAENSAADGRAVPRVRWVWGKETNVLGVVEAFAERLERFDAAGLPGRSWVRLRLVRVHEPPQPVPEVPPTDVVPAAEAALAAAEQPQAVHVVVGAGDASGETLASIAAQALAGRPWLWRWIARANDLLDDVVWPPAGTELVIPPAPGAATAAPTAGATAAVTSGGAL